MVHFQDECNDAGRSGVIEDLTAAGLEDENDQVSDSLNLSFMDLKIFGNTIV